MFASEPTALRAGQAEGEFSLNGCCTRELTYLQPDGRLRVERV